MQVVVATVCSKNENKNCRRRILKIYHKVVKKQTNKKIQNASSHMESYKIDFFIFFIFFIELPKVSQVK